MFYTVNSKNTAMNGQIVRGVGEETLLSVEYVHVEFCYFGCREYTWYPKEQLQPTEPPTAWFGAPPKQEWTTEGEQNVY